MIYSRLYLFFTIRPQLAMYLKNTNLTYGEVLNGISKEIEPSDNIEFIKLDLLSDDG